MAGLLLLWMAAIGSPGASVFTSTELLLHAVVFGFLVHVGLTLLRVIVVADKVVESYARIAINRVAA